MVTIKGPSLEPSMDWVACFQIATLGIAVEQARLPDLIGETFVLTGTDGLVQAMSDEAAHGGVTSSMSVQTARSLCSDLIILPYDRAAYESAAQAIWDALAVESSIVEPVAPELCYAQIRGTQTEVRERLCALAEAISPRVGVPVRIGIARTKFVAHRAAKATPQTQQTQQEAQEVQASHTVPHTVPLGKEAQFLASLPLSALPPHRRLDDKAKRQMQRLGIKTLSDIWALPPHRLPKSLQKLGHQLLQWAQGFDSDPVKPLWPPPVVSAALRFEEGLEDRYLAENALVKITEQIAGQLTAEHEFCRTVTLKIGLSDGSYLVESEKLALPESQTPSLYRAAMRLLQRLQIEQPVTSLEIVAGDIGSGSGMQLSLLDKAGELPHERSKRLDVVLSHLRKRYGPRVVIPASLLVKARRIHLWAFPLGHLLSEPLEQVATDGRGTPVRYWRCPSVRRTSREGSREGKQGCYDIVRVHNRWRETGSKRGTVHDSEVWRVETDPFGVSEIRRLDTEWRLTASWD